ncbi:hypothetical protein ABZ641_33540, partial [Kitasatospora sp. NPDC007106]
MRAKLPLNSPRWRELDGVTAEDVRRVVDAIATPGDEWREAWQGLSDSLMREDVVLDGAYAALPHVVAAAAELPPERFTDLWTDLG